MKLFQQSIMAMMSAGVLAIPLSGRISDTTLSVDLITDAYAADITGKVIAVLDGDTIEVLHNNHTERIRLNGIDCPEKGQAYGHKAKQAASELVFGKEVTLPYLWPRQVWADYR